MRLNLHEYLCRSHIVFLGKLDNGRVVESLRPYKRSPTLHPMHRNTNQSECPLHSGFRKIAVTYLECDLLRLTVFDKLLPSHKWMQITLVDHWSMLWPRVQQLLYMPLTIITNAHASDQTLVLCLFDRSPAFQPRLLTAVRGVDEIKIDVT